MNDQREHPSSSPPVRYARAASHVTTPLHGALVALVVLSAALLLPACDCATSSAGMHATTIVGRACLVRAFSRHFATSVDRNVLRRRALCARYVRQSLLPVPLAIATNDLPPRFAPLHGMLRARLQRNGDRVVKGQALVLRLCWLATAGTLITRKRTCVMVRALRSRSVAIRTEPALFDGAH